MIFPKLGGKSVGVTGAFHFSVDGAAVGFYMTYLETQSPFIIQSLVGPSLELKYFL